MNRLELWFVRHLINREVIQGAHRRRIIRLYSLITEAARNEFKEDNKPTLDSFLEECHKASLDA